jgi:hypothetical protein
MSGIEGIILERVALAIADYSIKAISLGIEAKAVKDTIRANISDPALIPAALEKLCDEAAAKAHQINQNVP